MLSVYVDANPDPISILILIQFRIRFLPHILENQNCFKLICLQFIYIVLSFSVVLSS
jgi:hypothetical protein